MTANNESQTSFMSFDLSRSVDQICTTLSLSNIVVPRIDKIDNVFDFINEFEMVTATLPEDTRLKLLVKAFPPGRHQAWFNKDLKRAVDDSKPWSDIKRIIIERYSDIEDRDRHLLKLQEMKFVDKNQNKLFEHVEDLILSFEKALPKIKDDDDSKIRFVKSRLPKEILPDLSRINDYNSVSNLSRFLRGVREYDKLKVINRETGKASDKSEQVTRSDLCEMFKEFAKEMRKENETLRNTVAAIRPQSPRGRSPGRNIRPQSQHGASPYRSAPGYSSGHTRSLSPFGPSRYQREPSPRRQPTTNESNDRNMPSYDAQYRPQSDNYGRNSPTDRRDYYGNRSGQYSPATIRRHNRDRMIEPSGLHEQAPESQRSNSQERRQVRAFDEEYYYQKFGKPDTPCNCGYYHWKKHCQLYLR